MSSSKGTGVRVGVVVLLLLAGLLAMLFVPRLLHLGADAENYAMLRTVKPGSFSAAPIVMSWRGFTSWEEDNTTQQCAVIVYDIRQQPVGDFISRIGDRYNPPPQPVSQAADELITDISSSAAPAETSAIEPDPITDGWLIAGRPLPTADQDDWRQIVLRPGFAPFRYDSSFCAMPKDKFAPFKARVTELWARPGTPIYTREVDLGGGVLGGRRVYRTYYAVIDLEKQQLVTWMSVDPSAGG